MTEIETRQSDFAEAKKKFNEKYSDQEILSKSLVPVDLEYKEDIKLQNSKGEKLEEFHKWEFIYSLINSGLYTKDYIGTEIRFPKGNKSSQPIRMDACIFDSKEWRKYYKKWRNEKDSDAVEWLRNHLIGVAEFKREEKKDVRGIYTSQVKPALKETDRDHAIAFYYDADRLYIFQKLDGSILRYDESKNEKGRESSLGQLSLEIPDSYSYVPALEELEDKVNKAREVDRSSRTVEDLNLVSGVHSKQINEALSGILQTMDKVGLVNERGYELFIQMLAMKIHDEKRSQSQGRDLEYYQTRKEKEKMDELLFYITPEEKGYGDLSDEDIQKFIDRMKNLHKDARIEYKAILGRDTEQISWKSESYVKVISSIVENLQDYSFIRSNENDLYQLVFYRFANEFTKVEKGQFLTPLKLIEFMVKIVNPRGKDRVIDPTVGIADFLSMSYVHSKRDAENPLDDNRIFGADNDDQMIMLSQLNMLLNGDGNAVLQSESGLGSLRYKFSTDKELVSLKPKLHKNGNWDNWKSQTELMKFDVVLTNPPFGQNRSFEPSSQREKETAELYELWDIARSGDSIDMGLLFLENAYQILNTNGRMGIVLSNSLTSIDRWEEAREWLLENMRVVALFDLPQAFADTNASTTIVIGYKPPEEELEQLKEDNYDVFVRDIENIGYEVKTKNRVKTYEEVYAVDEETFETKVTENGEPKLKEDFTETVTDFKDWAKTQEEKLQDLFLSD